MIVNILFGDVFDKQSKFYIILTEKEWCSSWKEYSQKDGRPYFIELEVIKKHSSTTSEPILLRNNNKSTR